MKKRREQEILCEVLEQSGIVITERIYTAVAAGLKRIRVEKYLERQKSREAYQAYRARKHKESAAGKAADAVPRTTTAQEPYAKRVNTVCHSPCEGNQGHHPEQRQAD